VIPGDEWTPPRLQELFSSLSATDASSHDKRWQKQGAKSQNSPRGHPKHLFTEEALRRKWCQKHGPNPTFGATGVRIVRLSDLPCGHIIGSNTHAMYGGRMAADLEKLVPDLQSKVRQLIDQCLARGIDMRANNGLRDPFAQARLWRQSRSREEIEAKIRELEAKGAPFLAHCIRSVGPQHGKHVTNTPPGISWHQWGEALDCFWLVDGKAEWSAKKLVNGLNGYHVYAQEAEAIGLIAGGHWKNFKDWPHVQLRKASNAGSVMSLATIDAAMQERFSG
jgi:hypothetical protein